MADDPSPPGCEVAINVRDCLTMSYQDFEHCANCYQEISTATSSPVKLTHQVNLEDNGAESDVKITVAEALNLVFNLHKRSHATSIILDDNKYSLCFHCYILFSKLFNLFSKFSDRSAPPSYLHSILDLHPIFRHPYMIPIVEIKTEEDDEVYDGFMENDEFTETDAVSTIDENSSQGVGTERIEGFQIQTKEKKVCEKVRRPKRQSRLQPNFFENWNDTDSVKEPTRISDHESDHNSDPDFKHSEKRKKSRIRVILDDDVQSPKPPKKRSRSNIRAKTHICTECNIGFTRSNHLKRHSLLHSRKEFSCDCGVGFKAERNLKYHKKMNCPRNPNALSKSSSSALMDAALKLAKKKQAAKLVKNAKANNPKPKPGEPRTYPCTHPQCDKVFSRVYRLKRHQKVHTTRPHACPICDQSYWDEAALARHMARACNKFIESGDFNVFHDVDEADPDGKFSHEKKERIMRALKRRQRKRPSNNARRYTCHCGEAFSRTNHLRTHASVHSESNFTCSTCEAGFVTEARLQKHVLIHAKGGGGGADPGPGGSVVGEDGQLIPVPAAPNPKRKRSRPAKKTEKDFTTCEICGKSVCSRNIKIHMVSHKDSRPMVCELCGQTFKTIWGLKCHQKYAHGTDRPFLCKFCGRAFKRSQHMVDHEVVAHSDVRSFPCGLPNCDKIFKSSRNLRQHRLLHQGLKYDCPGCGSTFSRKDNLKVHVEKHCANKSVSSVPLVPVPAVPMLPMLREDFSLTAPFYSTENFDLVAQGGKRPS